MLWEHDRNHAFAKFSPSPLRVCNGSALTGLAIDQQQPSSQTSGECRCSNAQATSDRSFVQACANGAYGPEVAATGYA